MSDTPNGSREMLRDFVIVSTISLFIGAIALKLYLSYLNYAADKGAGIDGVINLLIGFVTAIFLYLGIKIGQGQAQRVSAVVRT